MNRKIKFRGKGDNGWFFGYVQLYQEKYARRLCICAVSIRTWKDALFYSVDENTVSQYTGLCDKNGKDIYEGDIVLQQGYHGKKVPMVVRFECGAFIVGYHDGSSTKRRPMLLNSQCEVIGNIYDNKDLLED